MGSEECRKLQELNEKRVKLFEELLGYAYQLSNLSFQEEPKKYQNLMTLREQCISRITKREIMARHSFQKLQQAPETALQAATEMERTEAQICDLVDRILSIDRENQSRVTAEMKEVKQKVYQIKSSRKGVNAYQGYGAAPVNGAYTDRRG